MAVVVVVTVAPLLVEIRRRRRWLGIRMVRKVEQMELYACNLARRTSRYFPSTNTADV